jgi:hypothetical protein
MTPRSLQLITAALLMASILVQIAPAQQSIQPPVPAPETEADASSLEPPAREPFKRTLLPMPPKPPREPLGAYGYLYRGSVVCGAGIAYTEPDRQPATACGFGFTMLPGIVTEFGVIGPAYNRHGFTAYFSEDATIPIGMPRGFVHVAHGHPLWLIGYTRMFETGRNAFDYGTGFERHIDQQHSLQFELRDDWTFANPHQHNVMLRVVWITGIPD